MLKQEWVSDLEATGKKLKTLRKRAGLTQEQLAERVGVRRETIMRLEKAQYNPSLKLAIDISRVVEAPIEEIFVFCNKGCTLADDLRGSCRVVLRQLFLIS